LTPSSSPASERVDKIRLMLDAAEREEASGATLMELERRQDDVLSQLEELDQKLTTLLRGLGVTFAEEEAEHSAIRLANVGEDEDSEAAASADESSSDESASAPVSGQTKRRRAA
jgi:hypothetical protein